MADNVTNIVVANSVDDMAGGASYAPADVPFEQARQASRQWCHDYNQLTDARQRQAMRAQKLSGQFLRAHGLALAGIG